MASDELSLACRLTGLTAGELWQRYLALGGNLSRADLGRRLDGGQWPPGEDRYLAVVADEALREIGFRLISPPEDRDVSLVGDTVLGGDDDGARRTAAAVLATRVQGSRLRALFVRCAVSRAQARGVRAHAQAVRRRRDPGVRRVPGGR